MAETLLSEFEPEDSVTYDALVFCDLTTGPRGESLSFDERIRDIYERYGSDHEVSRALDLSHSTLQACHARTLALLGLAYVWFCALFEVMLDAQPDRRMHLETGIASSGTNSTRADSLLVAMLPPVMRVVKQIENSCLTSPSS